MDRLTVYNYEDNRKIIAGSVDDFESFDDFIDKIDLYEYTNKIHQHTSIDDVNRMYYRAHFKNGFETGTKLLLSDLTKCELREVSEQYSNYVIEGEYSTPIDIVEFINTKWK